VAMMSVTFRSISLEKEQRGTRVIALAFRELSENADDEELTTMAGRQAKAVTELR